MVGSGDVRETVPGAHLRPNAAGRSGATDLVHVPRCAGSGAPP